MFHTYFWRQVNFFSSIIVLICVSPAFTGYSWGDPRQWSQHKDQLLSFTPEFDKTSTDVVVVVGQTTILPCTVRNVGDKVVSWIRTRDLRILTSGEHTYTADPRFESLHTPGTAGWALRIRSVRLEDAGVFECQVNTEPKMSRPVLLNVKDVEQLDSPYVENNDGQTSSQLPAQAVIKGPRVQHVREGSTVTFTCEVAPVSRVAEKPLYSLSPPNVEWLHEDSVVSFQAERGGIFVDSSHRDGTTTSRLTVSMVTYRDSGKYTCSRADASPDSVRLQVADEHTEAMQLDNNSSTHNCSPITYAVLLSLLFHWTLFVFD